METSSGGVGTSEPGHHEPVPEPAMMDVVLSADGVQAVVEVPGCHNCTVLQKELDDCKRDRAFFVDIKRKMILTDTLIQKHQSKCQAFEEQQKSIQNLTARLAQSKRDCKVLEEQLATTLKDIIPWKKDKERFLQESQESKKQFEELHNKLSAQKSLIKQYESKLEVCDEEKAVLESDILMLKSKMDGMKQSSKKATTSLDKAKEDTGKLRKEISQVRKSKAALNMKFERAKKKIKDLCELLLRHGIKAPRMKGFSSSSDKEEEEEEYMDETDSSDQDEEGNSKDTMVTKKTTPRSLAKPVTMPTYHHQSSTQPLAGSTPPSRRPFPKMDFTSVACLSPLPPSPPDNRGDKCNGSDSNESDTTLAEAAAKIEAQLSTPVLLRAQTEQPDKRRAKSTRVSPRRQAGRTDAKSSGATDDPESSADGAGTRRGPRSLRKLPESSSGSCKLPMRKSFGASKRLELENSENKEKKRPRGRPRKVKGVSEDQHTDIDNDRMEDLSQRLQGRVRTLSSSDDEVEKKEGVKRKSRRKHNEASAMRTRSKTKGQVTSGQDVSSLEDSKVLPLGDDLALSSDKESKHSLYNPPGDSAASDGSETASIIGRKKRLNLKRQTLRKSSALSDSSESEDDRQKLKGRDLTQNRGEPPAGTRHQSRKPEASMIKGVEEKRLSDESNKSNKLTSDSETDSLTNARRTSRRLAHQQKIVKRQASIEEQDCVQKYDKILKDPSEKNAVKTEQTKHLDEIQSNVATGDKEGVSDNGEQSLENLQRVIPEKRLTRQVSRKLLRSMSSPPVTRRSRTGSQNDKSGGDGSSQHQRKPERGICKNENSISDKSAKEDNISSKLRPEGSGEDTSSQERTLLRNISSPARLTRSASRNLDSSDSHMSLAEKPSAEQKDLPFVKADHNLKSQGEQSSKYPEGAAKQERRLSQKRTHSDSQSSEDEKVVKSSKSTDTGVVKSRKDDIELSSKIEGDEDQSVRNDGKVLMRSETEEFVACMDDMPCMDEGETIEGRKQTSESITTEKGKTIPGALKDSKKRKLPCRQSKRIKLSVVDTIQEKGESSSCVEGVFDDAGNNLKAVDSNRESRNNEYLDRPSTSRGLESSMEAASNEVVQVQPAILVPEQRDRHTSSASLPSSGRNSPVSPIQEPFQGFAYTRPISPMSPERPVERVSPTFFDLPAIPRMLSPLPPSPPRLHPGEEAVDVREEDIQEVMSEEIPEAQAQPRMISPLFPTPVPFAVSPIPEMSVPPAISPIADVQHPPEISPIADVQLPALRVQTIQTISPGKSPQLPSPRIFHSVAPSDAITVRPQHSSPSYNQDKPTAIRSLNAVLDRDDNRGDHRSSFSKKLIARRSSAEEPGKKPADMNQNNPPSHSETRTGTRAMNNVNLVVNSAQGTYVEHESMKQPQISTREPKANESLITDSQDVTLHQSNTDSIEKVQRKKDVAQPPLLQTKSGFSEYLRRADGYEEVTAFSRVIPHRDENKTSSVGASCTKTEDTGNTKDTPSDGKIHLVPDSKMKNRDELNQGGMTSDATEAVVPDKSLSTLPSNAIVGNIWGQMASNDRRERANQSRKKKQPKWPLTNSQSKESDNGANPQFKVPSEPPIPAAHVLAQHSVQTISKDQAPRTRGQVFPGFVPASRSRPQVPTQPQETLCSPALNVTQSRPGLVNQVQDLDKTAHPKDRVETFNAKATEPQEGDSNKVQLKTAFLRPNRSRLLSGPVTPDQIKALKKLHLHDVLRLIREHSPKESVFPIAECIIEFLEQNSLNLFPAIYAKYIVGNTSTQPVISPHEEQISKIIILWTREKKRKNVMHYLLSELGKRFAGQEDTDLSQTLTFSRLFAAICRESDWMGRARVMCYDIIRESLPNGYHLLLAMAAVWPSILRKKDGGVHPVISTMEILVMHQLHTDAKSTSAFKRETAEQITKCLTHLCNWNPMASESKGDSHAQWLIGLLKDPNIATFQQNKTHKVLGNKCFETIKAVELLASAQGWEWTNNKLIIEQLWPVLKDWSKSLTKSTAEKKEHGTPGDGSLAGRQQSCTSLATACAVMKVIGNVGQIGLVLNPKSVEQLMKMLIAVLQQPSQSIPWPMQLYTARSIYDLSPSNQGVASQVLRQWVTKAVNAVPEKLTEEINNLGRKLESPGESSHLDVVKDEACEETK